MQVNKIQNQSYNTNFQAKLNITGEMFYGEVFDKMFEKASKIGTEKDVIDIQFAGYFAAKPKNPIAAKPKNPSKPEKHTGKFIAKFLQKGNKSSLDKVREDLSGTSRYTYREKAKASAIKYIDDLFAKYSKG